MALKTLVKVGSVTNLSDARYSAGMGVDFLGFRVIEGQPGAIATKTFQEIRGWITGPQIVAEIYGIKEVDAIFEIIQNFQPDYFELSVAEYKLVGSAITLPYILALHEEEDIPGFLHSRPAYILTDVNYRHLSKLIPEHDILAEISSSEELDHTLTQTGISGLSVRGTAEIRPGLKHYDDLSEILEALETE